MPRDKIPGFTLKAAQVVSSRTSPVKSLTTETGRAIHPECSQEMHLIEKDGSAPRTLLWARPWHCRSRRPEHSHCPVSTRTRWRRGLGQGGEAPTQRTGRGRGRSRGAECVHDYVHRCLHVLMHVCTQEHSLWNLALTLPSTKSTTVWILCEKVVWFETVYLQNMQKLLCFGSATSLIKAAAAAAKSLQSCPTLCDPIDGSPPGSAVPEILQARTLEWVAISFSNAWKWSHSVMSDSWQPHGL